MVALGLEDLASPNVIDSVLQAVKLSVLNERVLVLVPTIYKLIIYYQNIRGSYNRSHTAERCILQAYVLSTPNIIANVRHA
jgi:hypothetical protein